VRRSHSSVHNVPSSHFSQWQDILVRHTCVEDTETTTYALSVPCTDEVVRSFKRISAFKRVKDVLSGTTVTMRGVLSCHSRFTASDAFRLATPPTRSHEPFPSSAAK